MNPRANAPLSKGTTEPAAADKAGARAPAPPPRRALSEDLFGSAVELEIDHHGTLYRLRQTSLGKLILTK